MLFKPSQKGLSTGSDCQIGAAYFISKLDKNILKDRKALLLKTQENEVFWRRPFQTDDYLKRTRLRKLPACLSVRYS